MNANSVTGTIYEIQWLSHDFEEWNCKAFTNDLTRSRHILRFESKADPHHKWRIVRVTRKVVAK